MSDQDECMQESHEKEEKDAEEDISDSEDDSDDEESPDGNAMEIESATCEGSRKNAPSQGAEDMSGNRNIVFRGQSGQMVKHALVLQVSGDLENAVRMYLMAFKLNRSLVPSFVQEFKQALADHTSALMSTGRGTEAISLQNLATSILSDDAWAMTSLGRLHFLLGNEIEAGRCWRAAVDLGGDCCEAKESLDCLNSRIINRWHYRMINDAVRNECYQAAISRALKGAQGAKSVLDIGCGTGLLSMYAAAENAGSIYACEMSAPILALANDVVEANGMGGKIQLMHSHSEEISIHSDAMQQGLGNVEVAAPGANSIQGKVDVVVTETADCGLLGEAMLPSLQHAKQHLLAENGQIIPAAGDVFAVLVESPSLRSQMWVNPDAVCGLDLTSAVRLESNDPYLCEYLLEWGHRVLCSPFHAMRVPFDSPPGHLPEPRACAVPITAAGRIDAIVTWYRLWLDSENSFSTSPFPEPDAADTGASGGQRASCWEQAVFVPETSKAAAAGEVVQVNVSCAPRRLHWSVFAGESEGEDGAASTGAGPPVVRVGERVMSVINDRERNEAYARAIAWAVQGAGEEVLDLGYGWSLWGMMSAREGARRVLAMDPPEEEEAFALLLQRNGAGECVRVVGKAFGASLHERLVQIASAAAADAKLEKPKAPPPKPPAKPPSAFKWNSAKGKKKQPPAHQPAASVQPHAPAPAVPSASADPSRAHRKTFSLIIADCVDPGGLLRQGAMEDLRFATEHLLCDGGVVLPATVTVRAMCIESAQMRQDNRVNAAAQGGIDVGLLDRFSLNSLMSLDLPTMTYTQLTAPVDVFTFDLKSLRPSHSVELEIEAAQSGHIDGIAFWFRLNLGDGNVLETLPPSRHGRATDIGDTDRHPPHWRQAAWMLRKPLPVDSGQRLRLAMSSMGSYLAWELQHVVDQSNETAS